MSSPFRLGALREIYTQPLYHRFTGSSGFSGELLFDTPAAHIEALMGNERSAVFLPPVDYAQNSSGMVLYPGIGISSSGSSGAARLYFNKQIGAIRTMAIGAVSTTDVVLSRIVLGEKYESEPSIIPVAGTLDEMLAKGDCALLSGDALIGLHADHPFIDIVDEWTDITELPFVHTLCITRAELASNTVTETLLASQEAGRNALEAIAGELSLQTGLPAAVLHEYLSRFSYGFSDESKDALDEFFRMAFYHGMLGDVPEITYAD